MSRALHIIGIVLLLIAFIHLFLASVSLPYFFTLDFVRLHFKRSGLSIGNAGTSLKELRIGLWSYCFYDVHNVRTCSTPALGQAYSFELHGPHNSVTIPAAWTRGLPVHPAAAGLTFVALLLTLTSDARVRLLSAFASLFACLTTLIAFAIDIALFVNVKHRVAKIEDLDIDTKPWVAFWLTLVGFLLTLMAPLMILLGRRARAAAKLAADDSSSTTTTSESLVKGRTSNLSA